MSKGKKLTPRSPDKSGRIKVSDTPGDDVNKRCPDFSFHHTAPGYCVEQCDQEAKQALIDGLWARSRLTWNELKMADRKKLGFERIHNVRKQIPASLTKDVPFLAFRLGGPRRVVGFQDQRAFHIVWIGLDHDLY